MNPLGSFVLTSQRLYMPREYLLADRIYYVSTTGSDTNTGLNPGAPFLTIQKAVDVVCNNIDMNSQQVTIQLADGTYTSGAVLKPYVGTKAPIIQGNSSTPSNTLISTTSSNGINLYDPVSWTIKNLKFTTITSGSCIYAENNAVIKLYNINFGSCMEAHMYAVSGANITSLSNYTISGGAKRHIGLSKSAKYYADSITVTITGTPAFSEYFIGCYLVSTGVLTNMTFSGSATGSRYQSGYLSFIYTNGTTLPGNAAGSTPSGGLYF